jgi:hypothetical protein
MFLNFFQRKILPWGIIAYSVLFFSVAFASETNGTIDASYKYAWGENIGWINFGCDECNVEITDEEITGHAWSTQFGWINLNPTNSGVKNDGEGILSGYAWGSNIGWVDFAGVTIDSNGEFLGYATVDSDGSQINFNCTQGASCSQADFKVKTDWRKLSERSQGGSSGSTPRDTTPPPAPTPPPVITNPPFQIPIISDVAKSLADYLASIFKPNTALPSPVEIPKVAPKTLAGLWNLLPAKNINSFVFAPLPYELRMLAQKFPELDRTLKSVGVKKLSDIGKMTGVSLNIPSLANILDKTIKNVGGVEKLSDINNIKGVAIDLPDISDVDKLKSNIGAGKIALISGLPVTKFSLEAKRNLPTEFVFARTNGELIDLNVSLSVNNKGAVSQQISSLPGKTMRLIVKPVSGANSVTGYFVFKSPTPKISEKGILRSSLSASALFSMNDLVETNPEPISVENKLVISSFEYTDKDGDGIYTADVVSPVVPGEYEIITVIDYKDPVLGRRQMRMITVIDPEGYVFEENAGKETRIPGAIVSLYVLNNSNQKYELWKAEDYQQENPQVTDVRGTYSFLVPEGTYYFEVSAPGYELYQGKVFTVREGSGVHENIELKPNTKWIKMLDWQSILLVVVLLLLIYNSIKGHIQNTKN